MNAGVIAELRASLDDARERIRVLEAGIEREAESVEARAAAYSEHVSTKTLSEAYYERAARLRALLAEQNSRG